MERDSRNNSGHVFINGLLLGLLLGGGAVFLLGTKKGKKLLKVITEEGIEGVSELKEFIQQQEEEYEEDEPEEVIEEQQEVHTNSHSEVKEVAPERKIKRFFKRAIK